MRITLKDLEDRRLYYIQEFKDNGYNVIIKEQFAYSMYSYIFNVYDVDSKQIYQVVTNFGTKKECYNDFETDYYKLWHWLERNKNLYKLQK